MATQRTARYIHRLNPVSNSGIQTDKNTFHKQSLFVTRNPHTNILSNTYSTNTCNRRILQTLKLRPNPNGAQPETTIPRSVHRPHTANATVKTAATATKASLLPPQIKDENTHIQAINITKGQDLTHQSAHTTARKQDYGAQKRRRSNPTYKAQ